MEEDPSQNQIYHFVFSNQQLVHEPIRNDSASEIVKKKVKPTQIIEYHSSTWVDNVCMLCFFGGFMIGLFIFMYYYN